MASACVSSLSHSLLLDLLIPYMHHSEHDLWLMTKKARFTNTRSWGNETLFSDANLTMVNSQDPVHVHQLQSAGLTSCQYPYLICLDCHEKKQASQRFRCCSLLCSAAAVSSVLWKDRRTRSGAHSHSAAVTFPAVLNCLQGLMSRNSADLPEANASK